MPAVKKRASRRGKSSRDIEKKEEILSVSEKCKITKAKVCYFSNKKTRMNIFLLYQSCELCLFCNIFTCCINKKIKTLLKFLFFYCRVTS